MKRTALFLVAAVLLVSVSFPAGATPAPFETYGHPTLEAINQAYLSGDISEAEAVLYRFYFVKAPDRLPQRFAIRGEPLKCGTPILLDVYARMEGLPADMVDEINGLRARPGGLPLTRETEHFIIHYTNTGYDGVDEVYVDVVAEAVEVAWNKYHVDMLWDVPPGDGYIGGGTDMIDCYIHTLGGGTLGMAEPEDPVPGDPPYDFTGFFHVDAHISSAGVRRVTCAHEYMHVVQFGYYGYTTFVWYMENCAMMGEEWAYDNINDYRGYLSAFFSVPYKSLKTFNGMHEYGGIVWPMYKSERFDIDIVRRIWDTVQWDGNIWNAFDTHLNPYGYQFMDAYAELMDWCFYTNYRDDGNHFEEGGTWSAMLYPDWTFSSYPTGERHPRENMKPEPIGTSVMKFVPENGSEDNMLVVEFDGPSCTWAVRLIAKEADADVYHEYMMDLDENGDGTIEIPGFDTSEYVFMLTSMDRYCTGGAQDYAFWASTTQGGAAVDEPPALVRILPSRPNPFSSSTTISMDLPAGAEFSVAIYDASGRLVRNLYSGKSAFSGPHEVIWNGEDDSGAKVAAGTYFARISVDGVESTRTLTLAH